jgi:hypothetical protein
MRSYFTHGKVMLAGEYAVLAGVEALALPVKQGQWMHVWETESTDESSKLIWQAKDQNEAVWFECRLDMNNLQLPESIELTEVAEVLVLLLKEIQSKQPQLFLNKTLRIETQCEFDRSYGLGTSSTLINNLSLWSGIDAFQLQQIAFGGSGYDVAVGRMGRPVVYWMAHEQPNWSPWQLSRELTGRWYLVFPGNKQNSRHSLKDKTSAIAGIKKDAVLLQQLNAIVQAIKNPRSLPLLEAMLEMWQALLSQRLELPRAYDSLGITPVQGGLCKWLGAWGGDVLLVNEAVLMTHYDAFEGMNRVAWNDFVLTE